MSEANEYTRNIRERSERIYEELPKVIPKYRRRRFRSIMAERLLVKGIVVAGAGEGNYYMSLKHYRNEFKKKLGFEPYLGTLNLELRGSELEKLNILRSAKGIIIEKFEDERGMSFGAVKCFEAEVKGLSCWLIIPEKTRYKNVVEIISSERLREKFNLKDGNEVEVVVVVSTTKGD